MIGDLKVNCIPTPYFIGRRFVVDMVHVSVVFANVNLCFEGEHVRNVRYVHYEELQYFVFILFSQISICVG